MIDLTDRMDPVSTALFAPVRPHRSRLQRHRASFMTGCVGLGLLIGVPAGLSTLSPPVAVPVPVVTASLPAEVTGAPEPPRNPGVDVQRTSRAVRSATRRQAVVTGAPPVVTKVEEPPAEPTTSSQTSSADPTMDEPPPLVPVPGTIDTPTTTDPPAPPPD